MIAGDALTVERNLGGGKFVASTLPTSGTPDRVALGDVDGDGRTDALSDVGGAAPVAVAIGDADGDGHVDIHGQRR